jgi:hypothetical protein
VSAVGEPSDAPISTAKDAKEREGWVRASGGCERERVAPHPRNPCNPRLNSDARVAVSIPILFTTDYADNTDTERSVSRKARQGAKEATRRGRRVSINLRSPILFTADYADNTDARSNLFHHQDTETPRLDQSAVSGFSLQPFSVQPFSPHPRDPCNPWSTPVWGFVQAKPFLTTDYADNTDQPGKAEHMPTARDRGTVGFSYTVQAFNRGLRGFHGCQSNRKDRKYPIEIRNQRSGFYRRICLEDIPAGVCAPSHQALSAEIIVKS